MTLKIKQLIRQIQRGKVPEGYKKTKVGIVPNEWSETRFKKMFSRISRKNIENNDNVLTISAQHGLISQRDFFNKDIASEDKSNYYLLYKGEFAYNKSYSNGYPFGALKRLKMYEKGIVSPLYICFSATKDNKCPEFYEYYFESGKMNREIKAFAQEGARNHGLLNISVDDFFNSHLLIPPLAEQQKIAEILSMQDKLIELNQRKIEELKKLKKYYLNKMFPQKGSNVPEIRFKGFTGSWEQRKLRELGDIITGSTPSTQNQEYYSDDGIPWVTPTDIVSNLIKDTPKRLSLEGEKICRIVPANTILVTCIASIGKNALLQVKGSFNQQINGLTPNKDYDSFFLLTESELWSAKMKQQAAEATMQIVNKTEFSKLDTMIPKKEEQEKIGSFFRTVDRITTLNQQKCEELKNHKKALMQLLLTGIARIKI